jgi:hypothetical protein
MPDIRVTGPDGNVYRFKEGTSRETMRAAMAKRFPKVSRTEAVVSGIERGLKPIAEALDYINPLAYVPNLFFNEDKARKEQQLAKTAAGARTQRPNYYTGGKIAGEVIGTAPAVSLGGGGLAILAREGGKYAAKKLGTRGVKTAARVVENIGKSIARGGAGVRAPTKAAVTRGAPVATSKAARVGLRATGGAGAGLISAGLTDADISDALVSGALTPIALNVGKHGAGAVFDFMAGRVGQVQAAQIMRNLVADKSSKIVEALKNAPRDIKANTAEFLASQGLLTPELAAATRLVTGGVASKPLRDVTTARAAEQKAMRAAIRGGETQTEAVSNIAAAKNQMRQATEPLREGSLAGADIGRTQVIPLEREAARLRQAASAEVDRARNLLFAADEQGMRLNQMDDLGDVFDPAAVNRQRGIVGSLEQRGGEAAQRSLMTGADARSKEEIAANLRAQGLAPLDISSLVSSLRQKASEAEFVSPDRFKILSEFANNLERRAAKMGGYIDATGLSLARREMGSFVSSILNTSDPKALRQGTAQLVGEAQPLIDDAIEAAGGRGWKAYLNSFAEGMKGIERQQLQRELTRLSPARFAKVMEGDDPEFVEGILGFGRGDINAELQGSVLDTAKKLGGDISATRAVAQTGLEDLDPAQKLSLASGAQAIVREAMEPGTANFLLRGASRVVGGLPGVYGGGQFATEAEKKLAERMSTGVMRKLAPSLASPSKADDLLRVQPSTEYIDRFINRAPAAVRNTMAPMPARVEGINTELMFPQYDPETGEPLINIDYSEGYPVPIYGKLTRNMMRR